MDEDRDKIVSFNIRHPLTKGVRDKFKEKCARLKIPMSHAVVILMEGLVKGEIELESQH